MRSEHFFYTLCGYSIPKYKTCYLYKIAFSPYRKNQKRLNVFSYSILQYLDAYKNISNFSLEIEL